MNTRSQTPANGTRGIPLAAAYLLASGLAILIARGGQAGVAPGVKSLVTVLAFSGSIVLEKTR